MQMANTQLPETHMPNIVLPAGIKAFVEGKSQYKVLKPLGRGASGSVVLARGATGSLFAVKVVSTTPRKPDRRAMMEADINRAIGRHRRIVRLYSIFYSSSMGLYGMVFDFANWGSLETIIHRYRSRGERFPEALVWSIFKDIAEALLYLHSGLTAPELKSPSQDWGGTIVHGDVSPGNIVLGPAPSRRDLGRRYPGARLADFGLSMSVHDPLYYPDRVFGTPGFTPPEDESTPKADVYGLGMCMFYAARGRILYYHNELLAETHEENEPNGCQRPFHGDELHKMMIKAFHPDPVKRADSGALSAELEVLGREMRREYFEPLPRWAYPHPDLDRW